MGAPAHERDRAASATPSVLAIARVIHEANRAWQLESGDPAPSPPWDQAPQWQVAAAVDSVQGALDGDSPQRSHEKWCEFKRARGWTHGALKDPLARTHPCLVAYADLPADQRAKDHLFTAVVRSLGGSHPPV